MKQLVLWMRGQRTRREILSIIQDAQPWSDYLHPTSERTRDQEIGVMMSLIQNSLSYSDHLPPMNKTISSQKRGKIMSMIQISQLQSDHLHTMNGRTRGQEGGLMMGIIQNTTTIRPLTPYEWENKGWGERGNDKHDSEFPTHNQTTYQLCMNDKTRGQDGEAKMSTI